MQSCTGVSFTWCLLWRINRALVDKIQGGETKVMVIDHSQGSWAEINGPCLNPRAGNK